MSYLTLQSKALSVCDPGRIEISRFAVPLEADPQKLARDVVNFRKQFAVQEEADTVEKEDMVTLSCKSAVPKFNKEHLTVRVGLKLFSKELEEKLIGMSKGETRTLIVSDVPKETVEVIVERIVRELLPELTDELAAESGLPDVRTVEDVYAYCRYKQYDRVLEEPADDAFAYLANELVSRSEFCIEEEELATARVIMRRVMSEASVFGGRRIEDIPEEEFPELCGTEKQAFIDNMSRIGDYTLKAAVLGQAMKEKAGTLLTDQDYDGYIAKRAAAVGRPEEEVRRENSQEEYIINTYSEFFMDTMESYTMKKLKEVGEWKARSGQSS